MREQRQHKRLGVPLCLDSHHVQLRLVNLILPRLSFFAYLGRGNYPNLALGSQRVGGREHSVALAIKK